MSLINEALRKARQEAAEREAEEKGVTYRPPRAHLPNESRLGTGLAIGLAVGIGLAALGGLGAWWVLRSDAPEAVAETAALEAPAEPDASVPAEPAVPAPAASEPAVPAPAADEPTASEPTASPSEPQAPSSQTTQAPEPSPAPTPSTSSSASESPPPAPEPAPEPAPAPLAAPIEPLPVTVEIEPAPSAPAPSAPAPSAPAPSAPAADLPKLIEPPEQVGRQGESNVFVLEAKLGDLDLVLDFIVWSESAPFAQVNGQQVEVGQVVEGLLVESIEREQVTLRGLDGSVILRIR